MEHAVGEIVLDRRTEEEHTRVGGRRACRDGDIDRVESTGGKPADSAGDSSHRGPGRRCGLRRKPAAAIGRPHADHEPGGAERERAARSADPRGRAGCPPATAYGKVPIRKRGRDMALPVASGATTAITA